MKGKSGTALLSVYDKTGIVEFAKELLDMGWKVYASGGTAKRLQESGLEVHDVSELVGGEAILGHRVVTLSREIHAGLLADDTPEQMAELKSLGLPRIDLVCVDMYPLRQTTRDESSTEDRVIEQTDIGGPTLLHAAAKGRRIVVARPAQRQEVIEWLRAGRPDEKQYLRDLAALAELEVAQYILESATYLNQGRVASFAGERFLAARYGENPWQKDAGLYIQDSSDALAISNLVLRAGFPPSYTNYTDIDRLLQTITHIAAGFERNFGKVTNMVLGAKHGNVCGTAVNSSQDKAIKNMLDGDPRAIFGGSIICNFRIKLSHAKLLKTYGMDKGRRLIDILVVPEIDEDALEYIAPAGSHIRVLTNQALTNLGEASLDTAKRSRYVRGGLLVQDNYTFVFDHKMPELQKTAVLTAKQKQDMVLAWAIGSTSNSNTITIVKDNMLLGNGVGQQDRVSAAQLAVKRATDAGHKAGLQGATAYSDSFFPFPDAPQTLAKAGIKALLATTGSIKDQEVIDTMKKDKVTFVTLPDATSRGFYAH